MPYINKTHYFEYDFQDYPLVDLREVMRSIFKKTYTKELYDGVDPPVSALHEKYYKIDHEFKPTRKNKRLTGNFPRYYYMEMFQQKAKEKQELKAFLVSTFRQWGLHFLEKFKDNPHMLSKTGFPYIWLDNLPVPNIGYLEYTYAGKNMSIVLRSRGDAAQLLKTFYWECSSNGGATWFSVGKSSRPEKRVTAALEHGQEYLFRVYAYNPRHRSRFSNTISVRNYSRPAGG